MSCWQCKWLTEIGKTKSWWGEWGSVSTKPLREAISQMYTFSIRRLNVCESKHAHVCVKIITLDEWFIVFWHWSVPFLICCVWWTSKRGSWLREARWCKVSAKSAKKKKNAICRDCPLTQKHGNIMLRQWVEKPVHMHPFCVHVNKDGKRFSLGQRASCYT